MSEHRSAAKPWLVVLTIGLTLATAACSTATVEPTPVGDALIDEAAVRELLTVADIEAVGADAGALTPRVEDVRAMAEGVDPDQVREIRSWYGLLFETGDRRLGLTLTVVEFESAERAQRQLDTVESGPAFEAMTDPIGDRSVSAGAGDGIGAALAFASGRRLVTMHSTVAAGADPLVDGAQLEQLARLVERRL